MQYNVNTTHPLIPNAQEYVHYNKYVSIHSEDRDMLKYPLSSDFEIELPQDLLNVSTIRLSSWTFPANYNTFSILNSNITLTFKISTPYNPGQNMLDSPLQNAIFACLIASKQKEFIIEIEPGFYNPQQMTTELTNKMNEAVTVRIRQYLIDQGLTNLVDTLYAQGGYTEFVIVYNTVSQKVWFGNRSDGFILTNETQAVINTETSNLFCGPKAQLPDFSNWGLPANLGLGRDNLISLASTPEYTPRFYYGDVFCGDNGYWLLPDPNLPNAQTYYIECPYKINSMGPSHFYMEIDGLNCIDETSPYNLSCFTQKTNMTNGTVNSAFAKIPIPTTPLSQWFDRDSVPYKLYVPPAERMRRLRIKLRYHNNQLVDFGSFPYTFTLEFGIMQPEKLRKIITNNYDFPKKINI